MYNNLLLYISIFYLKQIVLSFPAFPQLANDCHGLMCPGSAGAYKCSTHHPVDCKSLLLQSIVTLAKMQIYMSLREGISFRVSCLKEINHWLCGINLKRVW